MKVQKFHSQFSPNSIYRDILNGSTDLCVRLCYVSCSNTRCSPDRLTFSPGRTHVDVDVELIYGRRLVVPLCPPLKCLVQNLALNTCHVDHVRHVVDASPITRGRIIIYSCCIVSKYPTGTRHQINVDLTLITSFSSFLGFGYVPVCHLLPSW